MWSSLDGAEEAGEDGLFVGRDVVGDEKSADFDFDLRAMTSRDCMAAPRLILGSLATDTLVGRL